MPARAVQVDFLLHGVADASGAPLAGGLVNTYLAGTTTAVNLYTAYDKSVQASNPIELDSTGKALVFGDGIYKFVITTSTGESLYTYDGLTYEHSGFEHTATTTKLVRDTDSGSDTNVIEISGAGAISNSRGGYFQAFGDEHATAGGRVTMMGGDAGTASCVYGTMGNTSILEYTHARNVRKVTNIGKVEYNCDENDSYLTHDISMMSDTHRMKIGGGKDTDTTSGGRIMLHGNTNSLAPGQAVISAGNVATVGSAGDPAGTACLILETRAARSVFLRTNDTTRVEILSDGTLFIKNQTAPAGTPTGGGYLYVESGALTYKGSSGTVTVLGAA